MMDVNVQPLEGYEQKGRLISTTLLMQSRWLASFGSLLLGCKLKY